MTGNHPDTYINLPLRAAISFNMIINIDVLVRELYILYILTEIIKTLKYLYLQVFRIIIGVKVCSYRGKTM